MSDRRNPEDAICDEISALVDASLSHGETSDTFTGTRYRDNNACPWCGVGWHYLPVTRNLENMRLGSYGRDEFGIGIVDPDYDYRKDTSEVICPGSEFHGPMRPTEPISCRCALCTSRAQRGAQGMVSHRSDVSLEEWYHSSGFNPRRYAVLPTRNWKFDFISRQASSYSPTTVRRILHFAEFTYSRPVPFDFPRIEDRQNEIEQWEFVNTGWRGYLKKVEIPLVSWQCTVDPGTNEPIPPIIIETDDFIIEDFYPLFWSLAFQQNLIERTL